MSPINLRRFDKFDFSNLKETLTEEEGMQEVQ